MVIRGEYRSLSECIVWCTGDSSQEDSDDCIYSAIFSPVDDEGRNALEYEYRSFDHCGGECLICDSTTPTNRKISGHVEEQDNSWIDKFLASKRIPGTYHC
jgi:hypothetical protein